MAILIDVEQGTEAWHAARSGVITASNFKLCTTILKSGKNKGEVSKAAKEYAFRIAVERISGQPLDDNFYETYAMRRGRELEEEARLKHEEKKGILVDQSGIILTDDRKFGASVDGFIDLDGCSEYKCFIGPPSLMPILLDGNLEDIEAQMQGQMWVTDRKWCDFVLYCPALKPIDKDLTIITVQRDDDYIEEMEAGLIEFDKLVNEYKAKLEK
tara:strand:+ start:2820 stop:3461 length:642 start_codon:yes stop_codon:yes gene_type:complete